MFSMFFLTLCFYSFLHSTNLRKRWCLLTSSFLTLIIFKPPPIKHHFGASAFLCYMKTVKLFCYPLVHPAVYYVIGDMRTTGQSQLWSPSPSQKAAKSPSERWLLHMSCGQNIPTWKITYSRTFRGHRVSQSYQNKSLHPGHARILGIQRVCIDKHTCSPHTGWEHKRKGILPHCCKQKAAQVYTTQFSPTYCKNINA